MSVAGRIPRVSFRGIWASWGWGGVGCQFPIAAVTKFTDLMAQTIKIMEAGNLKCLTGLKSRCGKKPPGFFYLEAPGENPFLVFSSF